jgi:hypothetical protein
MEDILFRYYFHHVFYMHCYFYFPSNWQGGVWLLPTLKRVRIVNQLCTILCMELKSRSHPQCRSPYYHYLPLVLRSTLLLLSSVIFNANKFLKLSCSGGEPNWQVNLGEANALLLWPVPAQMGSATARRNQTKEHQEREILHPILQSAFCSGYSFICTLSSVPQLNKPILISDPK